MGVTEQIIIIAGGNMRKASDFFAIADNLFYKPDTEITVNGKRFLFRQVLISSRRGANNGTCFEVWVCPYHQEFLGNSNGAVVKYLSDVYELVSTKQTPYCWIDFCSCYGCSEDSTSFVSLYFE